MNGSPRCARSRAADCYARPTVLVARTDGPARPVAAHATSKIG